MVDNFNSSNQTGESMVNVGCVPHVATTAEKIGKIIAYILIFVVAFSGNLLVLYVVRKSKHVQRSVNFLILNMVVSDLFIPVFVIPRKIVEIITDAETKWLLTGLAGQISCKAVLFIQDLATAVSLQTVVLIAFERLVAVVFPLRVKMVTSRFRVALIVSTWIVGAAIHAPYFYIFRVIDYGIAGAYCVPSWEPVFEEPKTSKIYVTFLVIFLILIPFTLLSLAYTVIIWTLVRERNSLRHAARGGAFRDKMNRNVLKMALTIVAVFAICWAPLNIYNFIVIFVWNYNAPSCALTSFRFAAVFLAYTNTAINPCVYFAFVEHYRRTLRIAITGSILHTSIRSAGSRLNARRETFDLTSISGDKACSSETKATEIRMVSSRRLRYESQATIAEEVL